MNIYSNEKGGEDYADTQEVVSAGGSSLPRGLLYQALLLPRMRATAVFPEGMKPQGHSPLEINLNIKTKMEKIIKNKIKKELADRRALKDCACEFGILGDLTRMKICFLLCKHKELSVSEIAELTRTSISAVSHSLKTLKKCCLVKSRRKFRNVYYQMDTGSELFGFVKKRVLSAAN